MNCTLCGTPVKVVGHTTKHYEPIGDEVTFNRLKEAERELKELRNIAALCKEEIDHGFDLPSEVFDAVERYYGVIKK